MLLSKYPRSIIKELKSLYSEFNNILIKNNHDKHSQDIKVLKSKFKILELEPNISIITILLLKNHFNVKNIAVYNKLFLITELYYIGFTLHLNVENPKFYTSKESYTEMKTYQVLLGDFLFTKIFEIILSIKNHKILTLFAKYNKKISEGMLNIKSIEKNSNENIQQIKKTYLNTYGAFVKLCIEAILILDQTLTKPQIINPELSKIMPLLEDIFCNINISRNIFSYGLLNNTINFEIKSSLNKLTLDIVNNIPKVKNQNSFSCYIDSLIARI